MIDDATQARFWAKVGARSSGSCWPWTGAMCDSGYGSFFANGRNEGAHRVSMRIAGVSPDGWHVLHSCHNRRCVNPEHLRLGTNQDNTDDKVSAGRRRAGAGERHGKARLTERDVASIRLRWSGGEAQSALAAEHGVSGMCIWAIIRHRTWRHVG